MLDLSPMLALTFLSMANNLFGTLAFYERITLGISLAMLISLLWSAASFIAGFFIIILTLRLIAYLARLDVYRSFWEIVDILSRPVLYRINRLIFRSRLVNYPAGLTVSLGVLLILRLGLGFLVSLLIQSLSRSPF
jgi:YggT family protein